MTISAQPERRRFTAEEVLAMVRAGVLDEDEPVELLNGELIVKVPQGPRRVRLTVVIHEQLSEAYRGVGHVQDHSPIRAAIDSLPEPDIAVVRGRPRDYMDHLPHGPEVILIAEVVITTERAARDKAALYARAGIESYWLVNVPGRYVDVHTEPTGDGYAQVQRVKASESVACPETDRRISVEELLP